MHVKLKQVFRPTGVLNRFTELRHSKIKYKYIFYKASSPPSPSSLLKLPQNARRQHVDSKRHILSLKSKPWRLKKVNSRKRHADNSGNHADI